MFLLCAFFVILRLLSLSTGGGLLVISSEGVRVKEYDTSELLTITFLSSVWYSVRLAKRVIVSASHTSLSLISKERLFWVFCVVNVSKEGVIVVVVKGVHPLIVTLKPSNVTICPERILSMLKTTSPEMVVLSLAYCNW